MGEQADTMKQMIEDEFSFEDKKAVNEIYQKLVSYAESDSKKEEIEQARRYIMNNWDGQKKEQKHGTASGICMERMMLKNR